MKELDDHDCQHLFNLATMRIKKLNKMLEKIIPQNDQQAVLQEKKDVEVEINDEDLRTFKIPVQDMESPVKITFRYSSNKDKKPPNAPKASPQLKVFVSQTIKEPKFGQCDASYTEPTKVLIHAPLKSKTFDTKMVYLSLYSQTHCKVKLRVTFN